MFGFWESVDALGIRIVQVNIVTVRSFDVVSKTATGWTTEIVKR